MSERGEPAERASEVAEPPATLRWSTTERSGGQVFRYRLRTTADRPTRVAFRQPVPSEPAVADVGFRLDAAPEEWSAEDGTVTARATVDPEESLELVLGVTFEADDAVGAPPPAPTVEAAEPVGQSEPAADSDRAGRNWDRSPTGVDPETVESAIESVETGRAGSGSEQGFGIGSDTVEGDLSIGIDGASESADGDTDGTDEAAEPDDGSATGTASGGEGGGEEPPTRSELREAVAERNEELMRLRAELAVARRERADLRETVRDLRETVEALADYGATDGAEGGED